MSLHMSRWFEIGTQLFFGEFGKLCTTLAFIFTFESKELVIENVNGLVFLDLSP